MFRSRNNYWSNMKVADWLRSRVGVKKPGAATMEDWDEWKLTYKQTHPFNYWLTEEFLDNVQNVLFYIPDVYNEVRFWFLNRFVDKLHYLNTRLPKGEYHGVDTRLLHGMFETLVDFVEVEKAWAYVVYSDEEQKRYSYPWWNIHWWAKWKRFRCPEAGIAHLEWEMTLDNPDDESSYSPHQAVAAKEQYELYTWWKNVRPTRPDAMDASGWTEICAREDRGGLSLLRTKGRTEEEEQEIRASLDKTHEIEDHYDKEDEEMLIRLIKIRKDLWT